MFVFPMKNLARKGLIKWKVIADIQSYPIEILYLKHAEL